MNFRFHYFLLGCRIHIEDILSFLYHGHLCIPLPQDHVILKQNGRKLIHLWRDSLVAQMVKNLPAILIPAYASSSLAFCMKFSNSSVGKESTCNVGDSGSIPRSGRSTGEGIGYPFQCPWASLVAQLVKNLPAMWETWVQSLGWKDPLEKEKATHSGTLAWRIPCTV